MPSWLRSRMPAARTCAFGFRNVHYFAAGATLYGSQAQMGYEYDGKAYDPKFRHVAEFDTCIACHDQHATQVRVDKCAECHQGVKTVDDLKNNRENGSLKDYNGNGDTKEGIYYELKGLQDILYSSIQTYAREVAGTPSCTIRATYPYFWFAGSRWRRQGRQRWQPDRLQQVDCPAAEGGLQLPGLCQGSRGLRTQRQVHHRADV